MYKSKIKLNRLIWESVLLSIIIVFSGIEFQENKLNNEPGNYITAGKSTNNLIETVNLESIINSGANFISANFKVDKFSGIQTRSENILKLDMVNGTSGSSEALFDTSGNRKNDVSRSDKSDTSGLAVRFQKNAKELSINLMKKLNLSLEQAADVRDALIDYQKNIYETRKNNLSNNNNTGAGNNNEMTGSRRANLIKEYKDADKKADDKIQKTLNKEQTQKYLDVKNSWWREVKDKVYDKEMNKSHKKLQGKKSESDENKNDKKDNK